MADNEIFWVGGRVSAPVGAGVLSGDPVRVGVANAVAITDSAPSTNLIPTGNETNYASVKTFGVFRIPVTIAGTNKGWGDPVYATTNGTNKKVVLTDVAAAHFLFGYLQETALIGTSEVAVKIIEAAV